MVVDVRSNSRISGKISLLTETCALGHNSRTTRAATSSLVESAYEWRKQIAIDCAPRSSRSRATLLTSSALIGSTTVPSARVRSATSARMSRSTTGRKSPHNPHVRGRSRRRISRTSANPAVVRTAVRAPLRSRRALVPTVVPWMMAFTSPSGRCPVTLRTPCRNPSDSFVRVDVTLPTDTSPVDSSSANTSVNVPPTSIPMITNRLA